MKTLKTFLSLVFIITMIGVGIYAAQNRGLIPPISAQPQFDSVIAALPEPIREKVKGTTTADTNHQGTDSVSQQNPSSLKNVQKILSPESTQQALNSAQSQLQTLEERLQDVQKSIQTVVNPDKEDAPPIAERALEYGQYMYCKQVVTDYEKNN